MSMHEMESWAELSVRTVAAAQPLPENARDVVYNLYRLQDMFDCGYTVLRVRKELERIGYLAAVPIEKLSAARKRAAEALGGDGFIGDGDAYYSASERAVIVTAGSKLWNALAAKGTLPPAPVRRMELGELAEPVTRLAAKRQDELGNDTLGLWYALTPVFWMIEGGEDGIPDWAEAVRELTCRPEALAFAESMRLLPDSDEFETFEAFENFWFKPYMDRKAGEDAQTIPERIVRLAAAFEWKKAVKLAETLEDPARRKYYRAFTGLSFYQTIAKLPPLPGEQTPLERKPPKDVPDLAEAAEIFRSLIGCTDKDWMCRTNLASCRALTGAYAEAYTLLSEAFAELTSSVSDLGGEWDRVFNAAALSPGFYRTLDDMIPDSPEKRGMLSAPVKGIMPLSDARAALEGLLGVCADKDWMCYVYLAHCDMLEENYAAALARLAEADRLHPDDPDVAEAMDEAREKMSAKGNERI